LTDAQGVPVQKILINLRPAAKEAVNTIVARRTIMSCLVEGKAGYQGNGNEFCLPCRI
jgi:hypothetical protein